MDFGPGAAAPSRNRCGQLSCKYRTVPSEPQDLSRAPCSLSTKVQLPQWVPSSTLSSRCRHPLRPSLRVPSPGRDTMTQLCDKMPHAGTPTAGKCGCNCGACTTSGGGTGVWRRVRGRQAWHECCQRRVKVPRQRLPQSPWGHPVGCGSGVAYDHQESGLYGAERRGCRRSCLAEPKGSGRRQGQRVTMRPGRLIYAQRAPRAAETPTTDREVESWRTSGSGLRLTFSVAGRTQ